MKFRDATLHDFRDFFKDWEFTYWEILESWDATRKTKTGFVFSVDKEAMLAFGINGGSHGTFYIDTLEQAEELANDLVALNVFGGWE